jgi:uncharacterized protein YneF (UPF0154 family)
MFNVLLLLESLSIGELFIVFFVLFIFIIGLYIGYRLFKWNMQDHKKKEERNEQLKKKSD